MKGPSIDFYDYFKYLFGFVEDANDVYNQIQVMEGEPGEPVSFYCPNDRVYNAGAFSLKSVKELREEVAKLPGAKKKGTFSLIIGSGSSSYDFDLIDVGAVQANPSNKGACFQGN